MRALGFISLVAASGHHRTKPKEVRGPKPPYIRMRTAGTEFDKNIKDYPKEQTVSGPSTAVQGLTFISEESDSSEEDELEGFGVVKEKDITEANAS